MSVSYEGSWEKRLWQALSDMSVNSIDQHLSIGVVADTMRHVRLGEIFHSWNYATLAASASIDTLLITSTKSVSLFLDVVAALDTAFFLYEAPTTTANGTALPQINRNRFVTHTSNLTLTTAPTVTSTGTLLARASLIGGSRQNQFVGAATRDTDVWILKSNTEYLLRMTNLAASSSTVDLQLGYRENYV